MVDIIRGVPPRVRTSYNSAIRVVGKMLELGLSLRAAEKRIASPVGEKSEGISFEL